MCRTRLLVSPCDFEDEFLEHVHKSHLPSRTKVPNLALPAVLEAATPCPGAIQPASWRVATCQTALHGTGMPCCLGPLARLQGVASPEPMQRRQNV